MLGINGATKTCAKCQIPKPIDDFPFKNKQLNLRHSVCKACQAQNSREWYYANQQARISQIRQQRQSAREAARQFVLEYLLSHPCVNCGETDIVVLDFDHVRGSKSRNVSQMIQAGYPIQTIKEEIAKCDVRCAKCHRIKTAERRNQ